ncbi:MAG TPA: diacylglycerol kinase family protein [Actinocrinis sp.]|jgi:diacylglycerol kinase (ATP)
MSGTETTRRFPRTAIIANPAAGSTNPAYVAQIEEACAAHCDSVEVFWTRRRAHAAAFARRFAMARAAAPAPALASASASTSASTSATARETPGGRRSAFDAVVAVGGDGTVREVVAGLARGPSDGEGPALIVLPGGTANSNFRSLWDDLPWRTALNSALTLVGAEERRLDLGVFTRLGRVVVLGTSTGLFAEATAAARSLPVAGRDRYQVALRAVSASYDPYPGRVTVDGNVLHEGKTVLVNIGGSRYRAGVFDVLPRSIRDDGLLDVCVIGAGVDAADALSLMRTGEHLAVDDVFYAQGRSVTVERTDGLPLKFEHDGEAVPGDATSFTLDVVPAAVRFVVSTRRREG